MVTFLGEGYETLRKLSYKNFIRKDVLESAKTASLLMQLDVSDKKIEMMSIILIWILVKNAILKD